MADQETMLSIRELMLSQTGMTLSDTDAKKTLADYEQEKADYYNSLPGQLQNYNCSKCRNKGVYAFVKDGFMVTKGCDCIELRKHYWNIQKSGLKDVIDQHTFDNFEATEPWQELMLSKTQKFAENPLGWIFLGGQSGCGKTHLCTAVCGKLLRNGKQVSYIKWVAIVKRLKALKFKEDLYENVLQELRSAEVLYIDDFLKEEKPSMDIAYEIIDARYIERDKITIITSEMHINDMMKLDEAVAGRIRQRSEGNILQIINQEGRNYRLKGKIQE